MESLDDVLTKRFGKSLVCLMKVIDPERKYSIDKTLGDKWDALDLTSQRKLYLYLLYRKWLGIKFYGTPYDIISGCHPYPTNWNGKAMGQKLIHSKMKMVIACYNNSFGTYTLDEARLYEMTHVTPLN